MPLIVDGGVSSDVATGKVLYLYSCKQILTPRLVNDTTKIHVSCRLRGLGENNETSGSYEGRDQSKILPLHFLGEDANILQPCAQKSWPVSPGSNPRKLPYFVYTMGL